MARAYSDDLRKKLLEAHAAGKGTLAELAERFGVSRGWAWKISSTRARTGAMSRPPYRPGRKARVDRQVIEHLLEAQPELFLRELGEKFTDRTGVSVSLPHLWRLVRSMGFRLKKSRSTPSSAIPKPTGSGARPMSKGSGRSSPSS